MRETLMRLLTGAAELQPETEPHAQAVSEAYWRSASDTYYGSTAYYDRKEAAVEDLLTALEPIGRAVDLGCGDGRYTLTIARHANAVEGRDISPALIAAATARAAAHPNVTFTIARGADRLERDGYDLVAALGVTSCIVDDAEFHRFLAQCADACRPRGHLILIDSLSRRSDALNQFPNGYIARYRTVPDYLAAVTAAGFRLASERDLGTPATNPLVRLLPIGRRVNRLFHFVRD